MGSPEPTTAATILPGGKASIPAGPFAVVRAIQAANRIHRRTYIWGGGHRSFKAKGYDCSGAVSCVGLLSLRRSQDSWRGGVAGSGSWITVFANKTHLHVRRRPALRHPPLGETVDRAPAGATTCGRASPFATTPACR
jgi:hypothetical protein